MKLTKKLLYNLYIVKKMTIKQIADELGFCKAGIFKALKRFTVTTRKRGTHVIWNTGKSGYKNIKSSLIKKKQAEDPKYRSILLKKLQRANKCHKRNQNKLEKRVEELLNRIAPNQYKFVGDGKVWIGKFNPDFINSNGQKKIIEVYGDYWHNLPNYKARDTRRLKSYKELGFETLILWEKDIKNNRVESELSKFTRTV